MAKKLEWTTQQRKVDDIIPLEINPRKISGARREKLIESLVKFNLAEIPAINTDNTVISGNQRLKVLQLMGRGEELIDVRVPNRKLTEKELKEYALIANSHAGEWDMDIFEEFFGDIDLTLAGIDIGQIEFEQSGMFNKQKDNFFDRKEARLLQAEEDDFDVPDGGIETDIVVGDLFEIGQHRLLCGDSTDSDQVARLMNGEKADMVFTDPPYGVSFEGQRLSNTTKDGVEILHHKGANSKHKEIKNDGLSEADFKDFMDAILSNLFLFNKGAWYICFAYSELHLLLNSLINAGYKWENIIIWMKNQATLSNMDYKSRYEPIIYGQPGSVFYGERFKQEDIWEFQRTLKNDLHPTMKPIPLIENALNNSSLENHLILDLFLGSGSTMVASHQLNRRCYGMEIDPKYCQVIIGRMLKLDPGLIIKRNGEVWSTAPACGHPPLKEEGGELSLEPSPLVKGGQGGLIKRYEL